MGNLSPFLRDGGTGEQEGCLVMAFWMLGAGLFVFSAVCGVCGARGLGLAVFVFGVAFAAAVASHVGRSAAF